MNKKKDIEKNPEYIRNGEKHPDLSSLDLPYPRSAGSNSMISVIDRDYRYETVNLKFCKAHRKDQHFFTGNTLSAVWGKEIFSDFIKPNVDLCLMGKAVRYEAFFRIAESGLNLYEVFMYPLRYSKGQVTHIVAETLDISTVRHLHKKTANIRQNQESFAEDLNGELVQSKAMDTFRVISGGIAHDLNNILTTIEGYAEMLATDLQNDHDCHEKMLRILSSVDKAKSITGQLLIIGKKTGIEKKDVDVLELLNETLDLIKPNLPHDVVIETDLQPDDARVFSDPSEIFRIFLNIITNAVQAMDEKGGTLSIKMSVVQGDTIETETSQKKDKRNYVIISFQDTGKGITPDVMKRIFEPLYSAREERKGSGLGLSVVYELVNGIGGSIFVSSEENIGSVFEIKLPMV